MKDWTSVNSWTPPASVRPAVVTAAEMAGHCSRRHSRLVAHTWTLDYEFLDYGAFRVQGGSDAWQARLPRTAHLYAPGTVYWEDTRRHEGPRRSLWLCFDGGEEAGLGAVVDPGSGHARFRDPDGELGGVLHEAAQTEGYGGEEAFWEVQSLLCRCIHLILCSKREPAGTRLILPAGAGAASRSLAKSVDDILQRSLAERVTLNNLADRLHVSSSTLSHRYKKETGRTPMAALRDFRVQSAKALLMRGLPLKAIAPRLGFVDAFHLSRAFKHVTGTSPRGFMRTRKGGENPA